MQIKSAISLLKCLGPGWVAFRCWKSLSERFGYWEKRIPSSDWADIGEQHGDPTDWKDGQALNDAIDSRGVRFFFDAEELQNEWNQFSSLEKEALAADASGTDNIGLNLLEQNLAGKFPFFSGPYQDYGKTPDWFRNPLADASITSASMEVAAATKAAPPENRHFSKINEFECRGDIKAIWELNRFGFVFDLVRAFARTGDPRCGQRFWELFNDWYENNRPYNGVNWKCGQESGLRMLAVVFGYFAFRHHASFTGEIANKLMNFLAATGFRIERHIAYAISQKNNHPISEAIALCTLGVLFPNLKSASRWQTRGEGVLEQLCPELIYDDGGFCQHSGNYHRLLLHLLSWHVELANVNNAKVSQTITSRFRLATEFLFELMDLGSGRVPRYGNDDGALLFPLSSSDYQDYRPVMRLAFAVLDREKVTGQGPWEETLFWFGLNGLPQSQIDKKQSAAFPTPNAGCHTLRRENSFALVRAGGFLHRPCQLDMMHVDLWSAGNNVAIDAGTYSYNGEGIWKNIPFSRGDYHNTVTADGKEPAQRVSNFLFVPWAAAEVVEQNDSYMLVKRRMAFETNDPVVHWRLVAKNSGDSWIVLDKLVGTNDHHYRLHWLLGGEIASSDGSGRVSLRFENGENYHMICACSDTAESSLVTGDTDSTRGYFAPRYLELAAANSFDLKTNANSTQFVTLWGSDKSSLEQIAKKNPAQFDIGPLTDNHQSRSAVTQFLREMVCA